MMNHRQQNLVDLLKKTGHISVIEQSKKLNVTEMTIRRDLKLLEELGFATRVHGGAVPRSQLPQGMNFVIQPASNEQIQIAKATVEMLEPYSTVMLNVGSTVLQVAREIAQKKLPLIVVTNSLPVAVILYQTECQVLLAGGTLRRQALDLVGPITEKNLDEYHVDILVVGCDGANPEEGFFTRDIDLAAMEKKSVRIASKVIIVTGSEKFQKRSLAKFADIDEVDIVVTDKKISELVKNRFIKQNIKFITV